MKKRFFILFALIFALYPDSFSQSKNDSLLSVYVNSEQDSNRISALHSFIKINYTTPDSAIKYAHFAVDFSKELKNKPWLAKSYNLLAVAYYYKGDLIKSKKLRPKEVKK